MMGDDILGQNSQKWLSVHSQGWKCIVSHQNHFHRGVCRFNASGIQENVFKKICFVYKVTKTFQK